MNNITVMNLQELEYLGLRKLLAVGRYVEAPYISKMKNQRASLFTYLFQFLSTAAVLFVLNIEYARLSFIELDMIGMTVQGIIATVVILFTLAVCSLIGLPLRLVPSIAQWWRKRQFLVIIGLLTSVVIFWVSFFPSLRESAEIRSEGALVKTHLPNQNLIAVGWFLLAFCLLHFYPGSLLEGYHSRRQQQV